MKVKFKQYMHDDWEDIEGMWSFTFKGTEIEHMPSDEREALLQKTGSPFYEITLECELDTETGKVTVLETKL